MRAVAVAGTEVYGAIDEGPEGPFRAQRQIGIHHDAVRYKVHKSNTLW